MKNYLKAFGINLNFSLKNFTKLIINIIAFLLLLGFFTSLNGQEFTYYTQYMFNGLAINPAYAGTHDHLTLTGNVRSQWVGIKGAPETQTFSAHTPIMRDMFGLGVMVINDKVGVTSRQDVSVNYSYKIDLSNASLSLGLKMGFNSVKNQFVGLNLDDENDVNFLENKSAFLPVFGFGAYYKTNKFYAGISIPHLYQFVHKKYDEINLDYNKLVLITGGYLRRLNDNFKVRSSFLTKVQYGSTFEIDLNANFYYKDDYCVGLSYKSFNSIAVLLEIGISKTYYIGYSYDLATTSLIRHQAGTHEFSVNVYLNRKENSKVLNPRYF